jgi:hypothetical protein
VVNAAPDDHHHQGDHQVAEALHRQAARHDRPRRSRRHPEALKDALIAVARHVERVAEDRRGHEAVGDRQPDDEQRPSEAIGALLGVGHEQDEHRQDDAQQQ